MRLHGLPLGVAVFNRVAHASQTRFQAVSGDTPISAPTSPWDDLDAPPDANSTGHLIFDTVNSVLQHWPHTRYRNGHSIIPGTVPVNNLLYHGRSDSDLPTIPEWTSTDPEHSFPFCGGWDKNGSIAECWQLTLVTTRPLKVLYFDGSSAAKMRESSGTLDVQDLLVWGKVDPTRWFEERERINQLCAWGREFGLDGFLRMEMDFEIMLCDFTQGVDLLSADYLAAWWGRSITPPLWRPTALSAFEPNSPALPPPEEEFPFPAADILRFETVRAGSWHNSYLGETRITPDLTRFISLYDIALVPSLVPLRAKQERWDHRVHGISEADSRAVTARVREVLAQGPNNHQGSGVDWQTLYRVVVDRYADRLELVDYLLNTTTAENLDARARLVQTQLRVILTPYILFSARPTIHASDGDPDAWAHPVWRACATRHTAHIHASAELQARLTPSESVLLRALDETSREICRVAVRMWVAGVRADLDPLIPLEVIPRDENARQIETEIEANAARTIGGWRADAKMLMAWLDWSVWVKCRPACGVEEMCYLPTWPFFWDRVNDPERKDERWKRPQPRCIRTFEPYSQL
ncbi:hypothetical protein B0H19DRAFT_1004181 [Mycena capillaripes]|nr:hypothetical protein B0H19DRAFT_1004181 [Mycena capillaripes]